MAGIRDLLRSVKFLLADLASTLLFVGAYLLTHNIGVAAGLGIALALVQIGLDLVRGRPVGTLQWVSAAVVASSGAASILAHDPRFIMLKPSLIYTAVGTAMLRPGWMERYLPPRAIMLVPDLARLFGFVWAGLMFASALLNIALAFSLGVAAWSAFMSAYAVASKLGLFLIQYAVMRAVAVRRWRARWPLNDSALPALPGR